MFRIETPMGRTPFQGASLDVTSPRAKAPWAILLDRSAVIGKCPNSRSRSGERLGVQKGILKWRDTVNSFYLDSWAMRANFWISE